MEPKNISYDDVVNYGVKLIHIFSTPDVLQENLNEFHGKTPEEQRKTVVLLAELANMTTERMAA